MAANQYMQPFFDTLSQGVSIAQSLRQAALQQQELQQQKAYQDAQIDLRNREMGMQGQMEQYNAMQQGAKPVTDGMTQESMPAVSQPMTQSPTGQVNFGYQPTANGTTNVPAEPSQTATIGGQQYRVPTQQEQNTNAADRTRQVFDATAIPISDQLAQAAGLPPGTKMPAQSVGRLGMEMHYLNPPQKAPPPPKAKEKAGFTAKGEPITFDPNDGSYSTGAAIPGMAAPSGESAQKPLTADAAAAQRESAIRDYSTAQKGEGASASTRTRLGTGLMYGTHFVSDKGVMTAMVDPQTKEPLGDDAKAPQIADMAARYVAASEQQKRYIADKNNALQRVGQQPGVSTDQAIKAIDQGTQQLMTRIHQKYPGVQLPPGPWNPPQPQSAPTAVPMSAAAPPSPMAVPGSSSAVQKPVPLAQKSKPTAAPQQQTFQKTATNPKTGKKVGWNGTAWVPIN